MRKQEELEYTYLRCVGDFITNELVFEMKNTADQRTPDYTVRTSDYRIFHVVNVAGKEVTAQGPKQAILDFIHKSYDIPTSTFQRILNLLYTHGLSIVYTVDLVDLVERGDTERVGWWLNSLPKEHEQTAGFAYLLVARTFYKQ